MVVRQWLWSQRVDLWVVVVFFFWVRFEFGLMGCGSLVCCALGKILVFRLFLENFLVNSMRVKLFS